MRKIDLTSFHVATSETARDINRRIVLDMIRTRQPVSRADLARYSGLRPSTISSIAEQLIVEQWITEGALGHAARGRKPRFLQLNVQRAGVIGINVRPATTTIALADLNARFIAQQSIPTATDPQIFVKDLSQHVKAFIKAHPQVFYEGIGVSLPGRIDRLTQRLVFAPNLGWRDLDLKKPLESATGLAVEIENAANACALARSNDPTFDDILRLAKQGDAKAAEVLDRMGHYLGVGMSMLITGIAPKLIVLVGEVTRAWERIQPVIKKVVAERSPMAGGTQIVPAEDAAQPRLRGTIALVLQKHFGAPSTA
ncbi:MAG: ROK family protein [Acidobacteria bacterium]|nr:ROK family protein [Acidobacteriota bacterium]